MNRAWTWTPRILAAGFGLAALLCGAHALAQAVAAPNTRIVNQASVTYTDATGQDRVATTNEVVLFVQQVYSGTLEGDNSRAVAPGSTALFPHRLTNTGNGADAFCIGATQLGGDDGDFVSIRVIDDADDDGLAGPGEAVLYASSSGVTGNLVLDAGESRSLLVLAETDGSASAGDAFDVQLDVSFEGGSGSCGAGVPVDTGANANGQDGNNVNRAVLSDDAILSLTKSSDYSAGAGTTVTDDRIDYVLRLENTGAVAATDIVIEDALPARTVFDTFGTHDGTFSAQPALVANTVSAEIASLAPGEVVNVRFTVSLETDFGQDGSEPVVENTALVRGNLDGVAGLEPDVESNTVSDTIDPVYGVVLRDTGTGAANSVNDGGDDDATQNDVQTIDSLPSGATAEFRLVVENTGHTRDSYDLGASSGTGWMAGMPAQFFGVDGQTPLRDSDGNGIPDTGPMEPGDLFSVTVRVPLGPQAPAEPHGMTVTATSTAELSGGAARVSDPANLAIGGSDGPGVDIAASLASVGFNDGGTANADPVGLPARTVPTEAARTVDFDLVVANEGAGPDIFQLSAWGDAGATAPLPTGWSVAFLRGDAEVTSTTRLDSGATESLTARVTVPADAQAGALVDLHFRALSPDTAVSDVMQDALQLSVPSGVDFRPDRLGQVAPCSQVDYVHTLINTGSDDRSFTVSVLSQSVLRSELRFPTTISASGADGFTDVSFLSVGDDVAVLENGTWSLVALVTDGAGGIAVPLSAGAQTRISARILASCDTAPGTRDALVLEARSLDGSLSGQVTDATTVATTQLTVTKLGAIDSTCDGTADTGFDDARVKAGPGECVIWSIEVANRGADAVCDVRSNDSAPSFTQLTGLPDVVQHPAPGTGDCSLSGDGFTCRLGNPEDIDGDGSSEPYCLKGGEKAVLHFTVSID